MDFSLQAFPAASAPHEPRFRAKDPISALTHFAGFLAAIAATFPLLVRASCAGCTLAETLSLCGFQAASIALYGASTAYHTFQLGEKGNLILKRLDHVMIYVLIVGSYLPICVCALWDRGGEILLTAVALIALAGVVFTLFWVTCPKWLSSCIYIALGWLSVAALPQMLAVLPAAAVVFLALGGVLYTVGGVIYALRLPGLERRFPGFGAHELFHLFVLAGTACHYWMVFAYLI